MKYENDLLKNKVIIETVPSSWTVSKLQLIQMGFYKDTEEGEVWDINLYRDDITNECRLVFYPTYINDEGIREVNTTGYAKCYKVIEEKS